MKKILLSVTFLLTLASITNAADKKQTALISAFETKTSTEVNGSSAVMSNYAAVMEENTKLRLVASELSAKFDDLASRLDYTHMMHVTISNLQDVTLVTTVEDAKTQLDYARMMNAIIVKLALVAAQ